MKSFFSTLLCGLLLCATSAMADTVGVLSPGNLTDAFNWSQLGPDGTVVGSAFGVTSNNGLVANVNLAGPNSITAVVCPAGSCSWVGDQPAGDTLLWTSAGDGTANGPVNMTFGSGVNAVGVLLQGDTFSSYTAQISIFNGATLLGTYTVTSDANADSVYLGMVDFSGNNITRAVIGMTGCTDINCDTRDFAIDQVEVATPEPGSLALLGSGLIGLAGVVRRRLS